MSWFYLSLFCALSLATADVFSKKALEKSDAAVISLIRFLFVLPPLYLLLYINGIPIIKPGFFKILIISTPLEITAMILYNRAIKLSDLSLTLPFLAFTPIFITAISYFIMRSPPNPYALTGIVLITAGGYLLNIDTKMGVLYPIKAVAKDKGSVLMLFVALIYSVTSHFGKVMIDKTDYIFAPAVYFTFVTFFTALFVGAKRGAGLKRLFNNTKLHILIGVFSTLMIISHFLALSLTKVEYMISVKRTSMLFGIVYGSLIFKERNIKKRLFAASVMIAGVAIIGIFG